jgi:hypothetical protein
MSKHLVVAAITALSVVAAHPVFASTTTVYGEGSAIDRVTARQFAEGSARGNCYALNGVPAGPITILTEYQIGSGQFARWYVRLALPCGV